MAKRGIGSIVMVPGQQQPFSRLPGRQTRPIRAPSTTKDSLIKNLPLKRKATFFIWYMQHVSYSLYVSFHNGVGSTCFSAEIIIVSKHTIIFTIVEF